METIHTFVSMGLAIFVSLFISLYRIVETKKELQTQIDNLKRELEEMKRKE